MVPLPFCSCDLRDRIVALEVAGMVKVVLVDVRGPCSAGSV